mmetsp:Transcript_25939/g.31981  ORF Transcript_25939/g.31981 Transcript_25939/m.31981 type:complete len:167 (+) Transcript_25939:335-835(+)
MIAVLDIYGFISSTVDCVQRNEISTEGAAGTVDATYFEEWVAHYLCPTLGNYAIGEPRSIVVMDNASTHMDGRVATLIRSKGAYLLYTAPYSTDLNPIECAFNVYKTQLKRNERVFQFDWYRTHLEAMNNVDSDICIKEFRKCGVPLSNDILTTEENVRLSIINNE